MREGNMDLAGLRSHFRELNDGVINALPPAINNIFQFKKTTNNPVQTVVTPIKPQKEKTVSQNKTNWAVILPWIILAIAGLSVLYYAKFAKKQENIDKQETPIITEKQETDLQPEDFLPDSSVAALPTEKNVVPTETVEVPKPSSNGTIETQKPVEQAKVVSPKPAEKKVVETNPIQKPSPSVKTNDTKKDESTAEIKTPSGWSTISGTIFKKNSAEVSGSSMLSSIVNQLKNSSKTIKISPLASGNKTLSEDRAYALREILIEKGISEDRISVSSAVQGSNPNGIVYRISN